MVVQGDEGRQQLVQSTAPELRDALRCVSQALWVQVLLSGVCTEAMEVWVLAAHSLHAQGRP